MSMSCHAVHTTASIFLNTVELKSMDALIISEYVATMCATDISSGWMAGLVFLFYQNGLINVSSFLKLTHTYIDKYRLINFL
jgi:hypothetical protein